METDYYLKEGKFTKNDTIIKNAVNEILKINQRRTLLGKISFYLENNLQRNKPRNIDEFRKRTASEIILSKKANGCSDYGIVFCTLTRSFDIPTKYIEAIEKNNLIKKIGKIEGHVFVDVFLQEEWKAYEPKLGFIYKPGYWINNKEYIKIGEGLDFSELILENGKVINLNSINKLRKFRDSHGIQL